MLVRVTKYIVLLSLIPLIFNCNTKDPLRSVQPQDGVWVSNIPFYMPEWNITLQHDNRIYETDNFLVFSDGSTDQVKIRYARYAEESFEELKLLFNIPSSEALGIVDQESKIIIYSNRYMSFKQRAFAYGFVLYSEDSESFQSYSEWQRNNFKNTVKHEMMHVLVLLLGIRGDRLPIEKRNEFWFNEGIAEHVSGGAFEPITNTAQLDYWLNQSNDHINPISIHRFADSPVPFDRIAEYYPMFGLAVRYLLDNNGLGKKPQDIMQMFETLAAGKHLFVEAFEMHMSISVNEFELGFFDNIYEFLPN